MGWQLDADSQPGQILPEGMNATTAVYHCTYNLSLWPPEEDIVL
jgi:hypothetical protein